jgi:glycosyltransferase involved in cell wall biosynthesis
VGTDILGSKQIRVALVCPGAASETAITHYEAAFVKVLNEEVDIDYVSEAAGEYDGVKFTPISAFNPGQYDVVHFQWGNNPLHHFGFRALKRLSSFRKRPAIVSTLHEVEMGYLIGASQHASASWMRSKFKLQGLFRSLTGKPVGDEYALFSHQTVAEIMRRSDYVIVHSDYAKRRLVNEHRLSAAQSENILVTKLCVDWNEYRSVEDPLRTTRSNGTRKVTVFLYVGGLHAIKSIDKIIKGMELIRHFAGRDDFFLVVVGTGPEYDNLRQLAGAAIPGQYAFSGNVPSVVPYYELADVVLCPRSFSRGETSAAIPEACASGKAVLLPDIGGWSEYVDETRGFLTRRDDTLDYAETILHCLEHPEEVRQKGAEARRFAKEHLSWQGQSGFYTSLYARACER